MMHASAISPPTSFREFSDRMNSGDTSELDSFCGRALSCSFLGSELARFPASGRWSPSLLAAHLAAEALHHRLAQRPPVEEVTPSLKAPDH